VLQRPGGNDIVIVIDGRTNAEYLRFRAFTDIPKGGGVFVATSDINRDGFADVIVASGVGIKPRAEVYSGLLLTRAAASGLFIG
jgi:hypothetical protein